MSRIEADVFVGKSEGIPSEIVNCVEEIFAVMAFGIRKLHEQWKIDFEGIISGTEHVQSMSEIPCFFVAVPSPAGIRVGIMTPTAASIRAGMSAGRKMTPVRGGMGNHGSAIAGDGEVIGIDQSETQGREHGKDGKNRLKWGLRIFGGRFSIHDTVGDIPGSN